MVSNLAGLRRPAVVLGLAALVLVAGVGPSAANHLGPAVVTLRPTCGPAGERVVITVSGARFNGGGLVQITFHDQEIMATATDGTGSFNASFTAPARPAGTYQVRVRDIVDEPGPGPTEPSFPIPQAPYAYQQVAPHSATATFTVPCPVATTTTTSRPPATTTTATVVRTTTTTTRPTGPGPGPAPAGPTLVLVPPIGPQGFVTSAVGANYTPGVPVTVKWAPGIGSVRAVPDASGRFEVPMLVLRHDLLGSRQAVGTGDDGRSASGGFLVVPLTGQPPGFTIRG